MAYKLPHKVRKDVKKIFRDKDRLNSLSDWRAVQVATVLKLFGEMEQRVIIKQLKDDIRYIDINEPMSERSMKRLVSWFLFKLAVALKEI